MQKNLPLPAQVLARKSWSCWPRNSALPTRGIPYRCRRSASNIKGGMEWVASKGMLFGRTGRPMSEQDKTEFGMLAELPLARIKVSFAVKQGPGDCQSFTLDQLKGIYTGSISNWKEVGGPDRAVMLAGPAERRIRFRPVLDLASARHGRIEILQRPTTRTLRSSRAPWTSPAPSPSARSRSSRGTTSCSVLRDRRRSTKGLQVALVYDKKSENASNRGGRPEVRQERKVEPDSLDAN